jgi:ribulose-5-phosphate 4-epimerase/fuculose-1-phosphate aldolase
MTAGTPAERLAVAGRSLFLRGLTPGRTGNLSVRVDDRWLVSPTGTSLGELEPDRLSLVDGGWTHVSGPPATRELPLHAALVEACPSAGAVVHLHSPHATALACLEYDGQGPVIPPLTPYLVMRVGDVAWVPYRPPGSLELAHELSRCIGDRRAALLANHGSIVAGRDLAEAVDAAEELEATARILLLTRGDSIRTLDAAQVRALRDAGR